MGGYNGLLGYGGARGRTLDMTDEEIYNKLRREYPGASTASLYKMLEEVKISQNPRYSIPRYTVGIDPADGIDVTNSRSSRLDEYGIGFTGFNTSPLNQQQASNAPQNALSNQITYEKLQNAYNEMLNADLNQAWNGTTYPPTYGTQPRYYTASQEYFNPPPMSPEPQKPAKKKPQADISVVGKRSIILDGDI